MDVVRCCPPTRMLLTVFAAGGLAHLTLIPSLRQRQTSRVQGLGYPES